MVQEPQEFAQRLQRYLAVGVPIVCVATREEKRAVQLVRSAMPTVPMPLWACTSGLEPTAEHRDPYDALLHVLAHPGPLIPIFLDLHSHFSDPRVVRALRDVAASPPDARKTVVMVTPCAALPVELESDAVVVDLPLPTEAELARLLSEEPLGSRLEPVDEEALVAAARGLTWEQARRAFRLALEAGGDDALGHIMAEKHRAIRKSATLELVTREVGPNDIGGLDVLKAWLGDRVRAFRTDARAFGLPEPRGMLVCGVQGCGKSLAAKATASVFRLPLLRLDFAAVFAAQSPELALREATRVADAIAPVVLWVDEIEKGLAGSSQGHHERVFGDFLIWLQEKQQPVFVAATANEVESLPPELARRGRFDEVFFVDLPAAKEREQILRIHLLHRHRDPDGFPLAALAKRLDHFSGAELEQVVISAMYRAFASGRDVCLEDVQIAARETVPLATMYEEKVQALRAWAQLRARRASADRRTLELFEEG